VIRPLNMTVFKVIVLIF